MEGAYGRLHKYIRVQIVEVAALDVQERLGRIYE